MGEYIKKSAVHEILYDCLLHGKSKYTGFYRAWDEIKIAKVSMSHLLDVVIAQMVYL